MKYKNILERKGYVVIDNFLTPSYQQALLQRMNGPSFEWYYQNNLTSISEQGNYEDIGFSHWFWRMGDTSWVRGTDASLVIPLGYQLKDTIGASNILKMRGDMTLYNKNNYKHSPHIDITDVTYSYYTAIYYVNDSDGDTIIFNETPPSNKYTIKEKIFPKANRVVIFEGSYAHTGHSPSKHKNRILINSNYRGL